VARRELVLKEILEKIRATPDLEKRRQIFSTVGDLSAIDMAFIINKSGASVATAKSLTSDDKYQKQRNFTVLLARELLNRINKSLTIDAGALAVDAAEGFLGGIVGSFNLDQLSQNLGRFIVLSLGTDSSYVFYDAIFGKDGSAEYLVFIVMHLGKFHRAYLNTKIPELVKQPDLQLTVSGIGERIFLGSSIHHAAHDRSRLNEIAKAVIQSRNPIRLITSEDGFGRLWYGTMGSNLGNFALVATTSLKPVKERVRLLWLILLLLALLVFVSALLIGRLLTEHFLEPIAALGEGMHAIEVRRFEHKVPILSTDEFGQLSGLMNHVLDGMKDLQVARIVQESLFPAEPLDAGGFRIWGRSIAMADIGGDYFDYFICRDGRLRGLVGDVSGHGVSAALIMGMAKCALTMDENSGRPLVETITAFNRFLLANIKKKKMMTMFLYSLNPTDNTLEFVNAGHNFPFLWKAKTGTIDQIGSESFPLGVRAKAVYKSETVTLEPGDSILFYTDGLVEASIGESGELIGYERAIDWFSSLAHDDPTETIASLFERFESHTHGQPATDDISMICLKRLV
ncbi:SpoIIE family protein phosphatase, partial [Candidatus Ozemobacteraceae bacterium]|nr:SpoIIE family protein phosphatase [Candidatus Ozemobacteraceae bacterium]